MSKKSMLQAKVGDVVSTDHLPSPDALAHQFATIAAIEIGELHSMDRWMIAQCKSRSEQTVREHLLREGFEAWHPTFRLHRPISPSKLSSKNRHKRRHEIEVVTCALYPGYVLFRRMFGEYPLSKLHDIPCCGGLCVYYDPQTDAAMPASLNDYEVELMRRAEARGLHDQFTGGTEKRYGHGVVNLDAKALKQVDMRGRAIGRLDESLRTSLFIEQGDRILRVITAQPTYTCTG